MHDPDSTRRDDSASADDQAAAAGAGPPPDLGAWTAALLCGATLLLAALSLRWRMEHDTPLLHYAAWLVTDQGRVPYVDLFETSMVGTFALHALVGKTVGYGDTAFRWLDLALFAGFAVLCGRALGRRVAAAAVGLFGCLYFAQGPALSLQRDYVGALLVWAALVVAWRGRPPLAGVAPPAIRRRALRHGLAVGLILGAAASIKPHLLLGLPPVWLALGGALAGAGKGADARSPKAATTRQPTSQRAALLYGAMGVAAGGAAVAALALAWLWSAGAWDDALTIFRDYVPLHLQLTRYHVVLAASERGAYLWENGANLGGYTALLPLVALGLVVGWRAGRLHGGRVRALALLTLAFAVYPVVAGQFWDYHWAPLALFAALTGAHAWAEPQPAAASTRPARERDPQRRALVATLAGALALGGLWHGPGLADEVAQQLAGRPMPAPKQGRVDAIAAALRQHRRPGESVQPLDWTSGAVHALLLTRAPLATSFLYNYHFYHHVESPVIQSLRARFLRELARTSPALVVDIDGEEAPTGVGTSPAFPALERWLAAHYRSVHQGADWRLLRRVPGASP